MGIITVANYSSNNALSLCGQSFVPNYAGPNGAGGPATSAVNLISVAVGYPTYDLTNRCMTLYIYSSPIEDIQDIGMPSGLVATSTSFTDGAPLDTTTNTRTFCFTAPLLEPDATYYFYFQAPQVVCVSDASGSEEGSVWNYDCDEDDAHIMQFEVKMSE